MKLQRLLVAIAFSLIAAAGLAAETDPPAAIGRLNHVAGAVSFAPAAAPEDWTAATLNRPITTGDRLWTDGGGRAEMHVGSLAIRMDAQTSLDVLRLDDGGIQLRLAQGGANLRVRRAGQPVEIATPDGAVVLNRPGSYRVNVDPRGSASSVAVRAGGQAEVFARNGSFVVSDGQQVMVAGARQDLAVAPAPDEFDSWAAARDRREDRVASTRYVPAEMTGYEDLDDHGTWRTVPQYGAVWQPRAVPAGWAPYRNGHWVWVEPWGWTWVDDAPWGFAPSHYGRWVWLGNHWAWAPGRIVARPVYAPAMVAFIGGPNFSVSVGVGSAPAVAWVPLGWREPYRPWYRASRAHLRDVNITHVTNVTNITNVTNVRLVNRSAPSAVTVVSRENFVSARSAQPSALRVPERTLAAARATGGSPVAAPERTSLAQARAGARPPAEIRTREAVAVSAPPAPARDVERAERKGKGRDEARAASRDSDDRPRVRVIDRQQRVELQGVQTPASSAAQPQGQGKAPPVEAKGNERARDTAASQPHPPPQADRRVPAPPADVAKRPTFDREMRQVAPQADAKRAERETERAERREPKAGEAGRPPQAQVGPQPDNRPGSPRSPDIQRAQQQEQQRAREQQAREQHAQEQRAHGEQEERQRQAQQQERPQQERQRQQQAQEQQARRQPETQRRPGERQEEERPQRALPDHGEAQRQQQVQAQRQQQAQQQAEQRAQGQVERQQQARQQAQQRAQEQAQQQRAQEQAQRQQQVEQRAQEQAQQRAQQQAQQRAQEQAQRQQQAQQRAQEHAQQRAQQQVQQQQAQQRAEQQAQQQDQQARQQRRDQPPEKGGRERSRQDKPEKG